MKLGTHPPRTVRLQVKLNNPIATVQKPLRVTARFNKGAQHWNVPYELGPVKYDFIEHTLCLVESNDVSVVEEETQVGKQHIFAAYGSEFVGVSLIAKS